MKFKKKSSICWLMSFFNAVAVLFINLFEWYISNLHGFIGVDCVEHSICANITIHWSLQLISFLLPTFLINSWACNNVISLCKKSISFNIQLQYLSVRVIASNIFKTLGLWHQDAPSKVIMNWKFYYDVL